MERHMPQTHGGRKQAAPNEAQSTPFLYMTSTHTRRTTTDKHFKIMQYNVAKRREVMDSILNDKSTKDYSLLMVQEHYHYKNNPLLHQSWTLIEPTTIRGAAKNSYLHQQQKAPSRIIRTSHYPQCIYNSNQHQPCRTIQETHPGHQHIQPTAATHRQRTATDTTSGS